MGTSASDYSDYRAFCKQAATNDIIFGGFRRSYIYTEILEHVTENQGGQYLECIIKKMGQNALQEISYVDDVGKPCLFFYQKYGSWSPTTLRYVKVMLDLIENFGPLFNLDILEVGGGYGGQCNIIKHFFQDVKYSIYDLPEPLMLTEKFLNCFDRSANLCNALEEIKESECDIFISNYALSELNQEIQDEYLDKIIPNSNHGYITYNRFDNSYPVEEFYQKLQKIHKNCRKFQEYPLTFKENEIIIW